jgi:hypothetical protein
MNTQPFNMGFERKIGYSFLGLLAGNAASLAALLIIATLQSFPTFEIIRRFWWLSLRSALGMSALFALFSLAGWTVIGLPFVLLLPARITIRIHRLAAPLPGALLGILSLFLIFAFFIVRQPSSEADWLMGLRMWIPFFSIAMLISGTAFAVYCGLLRSKFHDRAIENEPRSSGPQFFSAL